jgi:hypothetical protein
VIAKIRNKYVLWIVVPYFVVLSFESFDIFKSNVVFKKSLKGFDFSVEK